MLNPNSPLPLYHQLAHMLTEQIRSGLYQPGDLIPSETTIAMEYQIGRPTVRQAMDTLVRKGLIERKRGSGTYVRDIGAHVDIFSLAGTSQAFLTKGIQTQVKLVAPMKTKQVVSEPDNPFNQSEAFYFSRRTLVDGSAVLFEEFFLHPVLFSGIDALDLENRSLSEIVMEQYHMKPECGQQIFKVSTPGKEISRFLDLSSSDTVLEVQRILDFPGNPEVLYSRLFCRTDRFAFSQTIRIVP